MMAKNALATQTDRENGWELIRLLFQPPEINLQDSIVNARKAEVLTSRAAGEISECRGLECG